MDELTPHAEEPGAPIAPGVPMAHASSGNGAGPDDVDDEVRLLAPFDPIVWDRRRFELFWKWPYRFEAYTPVNMRRFGYYALPLLWRAQVIGWVNVSVRGGRLSAEPGYVASSPPRERAFSRALEAELHRMADFLGTGRG